MINTRRGLPALLALAAIALFILAAQPRSDAQAPATTTASTQAAVTMPTILRVFGDRRFAATSADDFRSADFSPDGTRLLTAGDLARVWDFHTGTVVQTIEHDNQSCDHAAYLNDRTIVVAWHTDTKIELDVHDLATGKLLRNLDCDETVPLTELVASRDGSWIAVVGAKVSLIDTDTGRRIAMITEIAPPPAGFSRTLPAPRVRFTNDGTRLMVVGSDKKALFYDARTGQPVDIAGFDTGLGGALSGDGRTIAVAQTETRLFDVASRQVIPLPAPSAEATTEPSDPREHSHICCMNFGPDGTLVAATSAPNARLFIWDTAVRPVARPKIFRSRHVLPMSLSFSRDGKYLAVLSSGTRPELVDLTAGRMACPPSDHMAEITAIALSPDGSSLITGDTRGSMARWEVATGRLISFRDGAGPLGFAPAPGALQYLPGGRSVLVGSQIGDVDECDPWTLKNMQRRAVQAPDPQTGRMVVPAAGAVFSPAAPAFSPDGDTVAEWFSRSEFKIFQRTTGRRLQTIRTINPVPTALAISTDGKTAAVPVAGGLDTYLIATGGKAVKRSAGLLVTPQARPIFSPDRKSVFLMDLTNLTRWDAGAGTADDAGQARFTIPIHGTGTGAFDNVGCLLAVGSFGTFDGKRDLHHPTLTLVEAETGRLVAAPFDVPTSAVSILFLPHEPKLFVAGPDGTATLLDLAPLFADPSLEKTGESELWETAGGDDAAAGYRAVFEIARRGRLLARSAELSATPEAAGDRYRKWTSDLSSPTEAVREAAHKHLEAAGPAALPDVRTALAAHPGGEAEERLTAIAALLEQAAPATTAAIAPEVLRTQRFVQVLDWTPGEAAKAELARLTASAAK